MKNVLKKLVKSATQVLKKCSVKKLVDGVNHIGNSNLLLKRELIKGFDSSFNKLVNTMETVKFDTNRLVPKYIDNDYEVVTSVEVREKTTKLSSDSKVVYMSTTYYMYLQKHIVNLKLHVKTPVDPIIIDFDNEVVGVVLPIRITGKELLKGDCIIPNLNITIDRRLQSLDIHDVKSLNIEDKNILKDLGFKYYASQKVYYRSYKKDVIQKLNLEITNASFEDEKTLEQLKVELDKKEELKRQQKEDKINDLSVEESKNNVEVENMEKYLLNKLDDNMYSYCYDIENVNNEIEKYNDSINQINSCKDLNNMTEILENYINENKSKLVKKIKYIQHEDIMYNLTPLSSKKIENDNIKKSYFECKADSYNELLNNFNNNGMSHNDCYLDGASFNEKSILIDNSATYTINELMIFSNNDYDLLTNNLMNNIKVFENKGGSDILDNGSYLNHKCILCVNEDKTQAILIDPQFTNYANFSGLIDLPTALQYFNEEVVVVENITNKANDLIENIEIEKGLDANSYVKYCKENNIKTDDKNSINRKALQIHLLKYGKSSIWYKAAEKKNVKTKEDLIKVYFNELVNMLKSENIDLIKDNKITISSPENNKIDMNLQLLASKKGSKLNVIKQLEDVLNGFNNALDELYSIDCIYDNDDFNNINNFIEEYKNKNNILDDYFNINDVIDNLTKQIEGIKDLIESDVKDLYKNELNYHSSKYGKIEVTELKNEVKEDLKEDIKKDVENNLIELSTLSEQRKTIKNNCDKIYKILESGDVKNDYLSETYFQLNSLNENIKSNKKIKEDKLIKNMNDITYNLRKIMEDENINKRRYKTISSVHDTMNDILYRNILGFNTEPEEIDDYIPF